MWVEKGSILQSKGEKSLDVKLKQNNYKIEDNMPTKQESQILLFYLKTMVQIQIPSHIKSMLPGNIDYLSEL